LTSGTPSAGLVAGSKEVRFSARRGLREWEAFRFLARQGRHAPVLCGLYWPEAALVHGATGRAPLILAHGTELLARGGVGGWVRAQIRRRALEGAELVLANSHFTADLVRAAAPAARCSVLPLAVDHERFSPGDRLAARIRLALPEHVRIVASVGRVHPYKGHRIVIQALARLEPELRSHLLFAVAGTGPATASLEQLARELGVTDQVRFLGYVPESDLPDLYRAADVHALLSEHTASDVEGFGLVSLEAQACATPAIGSRSGGISDAIDHGRGGWLVPPGDVEAVMKHLVDLVETPDLYRAAGAVARARVLAECTWSHCADVVLRAAHAASVSFSMRSQPS
jgi:phosphatidylinositol alpha-1,6-mannosyltransferase